MMTQVLNKATLYQVNMVSVYISSSEKSLRLLESITKQKLRP